MAALHIPSYIGVMVRDHTLEKIRAAEPALRRLGLASVVLFGSLARGDADENSDIDIAVRPAPGITFGADSLLGLYGFFSDLFERERPIDVVVLPSRNRALGEAIEKDAVIAFA